MINLDNENRAALQEVKEFVTRVWEHPLVDDATRTHRTRARTRLSNLLIGAGFSADEFVTIPVGSLLWAADTQSDFDYNIIFATNELRRGVEYNPSLKYTFGRQEIDVHDFLDTETIDNHPQSFADLFLTPDEYIAGNTDLVAALRLEGIEHFVQPEHEMAWDSVIRRTFDNAYRYWDSVQPKHRIYARKSAKDGDRNRSHRVNTRLQQRAQQTHAPERYIQAFQRARAKTQLPDLTTYQRALTASNGRLNILPNRAAKGIISR